MQAVRPVLPSEQPCVVFERIVLVGADAPRFRWLAITTDTFVGQCIGHGGINAILSWLNAQLLEQGYATSRVTLGSQSLPDGQLSLHLHIGHIGSITMVDADTKQADVRWGGWSGAFPTGPGRELNIRDLEQGVEQMKRLPTQWVGTSLTPGEGPDVSDVIIERRAPDNVADRVRGGVGIDNSGSPMLGRTQASLNVALDSPLALNDVVSISLNGNAEHPRRDHRSQSASVNYSVPVGYGLVSASFSHSRFAQNVQLTTAQLLSHGISDTASARYEHVVVKTAGSKASLHGDVSTRNSRSYLADLELEQNRRRTTFVESGADFRKLYPNNASMDLSVAYRCGVSWLGAQEDLPPEAGGVTLRPRLWTVTAAASVPFVQPLADGSPGRQWTLSTLLRGQKTRGWSTSLDQFSIGSRGSVRGFDGDAVLLAENGWAWRNEVSTPVRLPGAEGSLYLGVDVGRVWGPSDIDLVGHTLAGAVVGVRARVQSLQFDVALATPIVKPDGFRSSSLNAYLSATYAF